MTSGANIEAANRLGFTSLFLACNETYLDIVEYLIENKSNMEAKSREGQTVLMRACAEGVVIKTRCLCQTIPTAKYARESFSVLSFYSGHQDLVELLDAKGANKDETDKKRWTSLIYAYEHKYVDIMKFLVTRGANLDAQCNEGLTVLMRASSTGAMELVTYCTEQRANADVANEEGITAALLAYVASHIEVVTFLVEFGVNTEAKGRNLMTLLLYASEVSKMTTGYPLYHVHPPKKLPLRTLP